MARPQKEGLDYFPIDVDIDQDDKIALIEARHGLQGFGIVIKLYMKIYKTNYIYEWNEKEQLLFSKRVNVDINQVNEVISDCLKWEIFDKSLFEMHKVLTSRGIQRRYLKAAERRQSVEMDSKYLLINEKEVNNYRNLIIVNINSHTDGINDDINPQRIEENSKEENSKEENTVTTSTDHDDVNEEQTIQPGESLTVKKAGTAAGTETREQPSKTLDERRFDELWAAYPKKVGKKAAQTSWKKLKTDTELYDKIMTAIGRARVTEQWQRENGRYIPNPATWLNQGRWDDEYEEVAPNGVNSKYFDGNKQQADTAAQGTDNNKPDALAGFKTIDEYDFK